MEFGKWGSNVFAECWHGEFFDICTLRARVWVWWVNNKVTFLLWSTIEEQYSGHLSIKASKDSTFFHFSKLCTKWLLESTNLHRIISIFSYFRHCQCLKWFTRFHLVKIWVLWSWTDGIDRCIFFLIGLCKQ